MIYDIFGISEISLEEFILILVFSSRIAIYIKLNVRVVTQNDYIKQESSKNYEAAFKAFYEIFPYGRFAHFAATSAILEAILSDADIVHVVDFDMGGVQWPPMIQAIGHQGKSIKLTSIKQEQQNCGFEETKKRLLSHARAFSVNLTGGGESIGELKNSGGEREWMGIQLSVYESMEENFLTYLTKARITMESLFVALYVNSISWFQKWEESREGSVFHAELGLEGKRLSKESLMEAKEMVKERECAYSIKIEGDTENEMVLEWRGLNW